MRSESTSALGQPNETKLIFRADSASARGATGSTEDMGPHIMGFGRRCEQCHRHMGPFCATKNPGGFKEVANIATKFAHAGRVRRDSRDGEAERHQNSIRTASEQHQNAENK